MNFTMIPRWALYAILSLAAVACIFSMYVSTRRYKTDRTARRLLEQGKLRITISQEDIKKVAENVRNATQN